VSERLKIECDFSRKRPGRKVGGSANHIVHDAPAGGPSWSGPSSDWDTFNPGRQTSTSADAGPSVNFRDGDRSRSVGTSVTPTNTRDPFDFREPTYQTPGDGRSVMSLNVADHLDPELPSKQDEAVVGSSRQNGGGNDSSRGRDALDSQDDRSEFPQVCQTGIRGSKVQSFPTLSVNWR
jgi:hypothetical protein